MVAKLKGSSLYYTHGPGAHDEKTSGKYVGISRVSNEKSVIAAVPVFVYAAVFVLVELVCLQFEHHALAHAVVEKISHRTRRLATFRSLVAFALFLTAMFVLLKFPYWGFGLVCCAVLLYLQPKPPGSGKEGADTVG
jgi:hypothetical protein